MKELVVKSSAFEENKLIPSKYTCEGQNINPPLSIEGIPKEAQSLALIIEDPDAPAGLFTHWLTWNLPTTGTIEEHSSPSTEGLNTSRKPGYTGPCPPFGTHRYFFKVYALDTKLKVAPSSDRKTVENAMQGHILAQGELMAIYRKSK